MVRTPWQIQKSVIFALFIRELRSRFGSYKGGYVWFLIEPIAHIVIISLIFSFIRGTALFGIDLPVFLATGVIPFLLFKNIALRVMDGVNANRNLFSFKQIKPIDTFLARTLLDTLISIAVFIIVLFGLYWLGMDVPFHEPLKVMGIYALLILMGLGLGMFFCVVTHYLPESKTLIRLSMMPMYLISGIIFPLNSLPQSLLSYLMWNPLLHAIEILRDAFFMQYHAVVGVSPLFVVLATIVIMALGFALYWNRRLELLAT